MPPVFAHGALRLYLLALLEEGPKHGYDVIKALGERFGGTYSPSAGTVYPRLAKLAEEGLVATTMEGRRTVYTITDAGRAELAAKQDELREVEENIAASVRRLADELRTEVRDNMRSLRASLAAGAESARSSARQHQGWPATPRPKADLAAIKEAELLLQSFRDDLRVELRLHNTRYGLEAVTLETLRTVLDQAAVAVRATLHG